jgi:hypothetical protein
MVEEEGVCACICERQEGGEVGRGRGKVYGRKRRRQEIRKRRGQAKTKAESAGRHLTRARQTRRQEHKLTERQGGTDFRRRRTTF